jgi:hypothetical protein
MSEPKEIQTLIARLRSAADLAPNSHILIEAADALAAQAERITALEASNAHLLDALRAQSDKIQKMALQAISDEANREGLIEHIAELERIAAGAEPWQPIETAPKDGTVIDLWIGGEFAGRRDSCYWGKPDHCCGEHGRYCDSDWHDLDDGWVDDMNMPLSGEEPPSHWMSLPAAPLASQSAHKGPPND